MSFNLVGSDFRSLLETRGFLNKLRCPAHSECVSLLRVCMFGCKDQNFKEYFPYILHLFWRTDPRTVPLHVIPSMALMCSAFRSLSSRKALARRWSCSCSLCRLRRAWWSCSFCPAARWGREEPRHQSSPGTVPWADHEPMASPASQQRKAAPSWGLGCTYGHCASSKGLFLCSDLSLGASLLANRKTQTPGDAVPVGN